MIRISEGTAAAFGLSRALPETLPTTAYFLVGESCLLNCSFCAQARDVPLKEKERLGRVFWPSFDWDELAPPLMRGGKERFTRICLQAVRDPRKLIPILEALFRLRDLTALPVSVSARVQDREEARVLLEAGADRINISLDAASEKVHLRVKGDSLRQRLEFLLECARTWPGRISTHLICGLGESEEDLLQVAARLIKEKVTVGLFAFTPLRGTLLAENPPPSPASYRRIQAGLQVLKTDPASFSFFRFENGKLSTFGFSESEMLDLLQDGKAFQTAGCTGCNRPYYNERPGGMMYNFPRPLTEKETEMVLNELWHGLKW